MYKQMFFYVMIILIMLLFGVNIQAQTISFNPDSGVVEVGEILDVNIFVTKGTEAITSVQAYVTLNGPLELVNGVDGIVFDPLWNLVGRKVVNGNLLELAAASSSGGCIGDKCKFASFNLRGTGEGSASLIFVRDKTIALDIFNNSVLSDFTDGYYTVAVAPVIDEQPTNARVCEGAAAKFHVAASGTPSLIYQWLKNAIELNNGENISGADSDELIINPVEEDDLGNYSCRVSNVAGSVMSDTASLSLKKKTVITTQPQDRNALDGEDVEFFIEADGEGELKYQWQKNRVNIEGEKSASLNLYDVSVSDEGAYRCKVEGDCGQVVVSDEADLKIVTSTPTPTATPSPTSTPTPTPTPTPEQHEFIDFLLGRTSTIPTDVNGDGKIDVGDLIWLIIND
jgi:immunoglobulin I-set domain protein/Ig-like domain-containing protein